MSNNNRNNENPFAAIFFLILLAGVILALSPGMLAIYLFTHFSDIELDKGQMWTFSAITSVIIYSGFYWRIKDAKEAFTMYGILSFFIIAILLILSFGFKLQFPAEAWVQFF